jgi:hypothetical protein
LVGCEVKADGMCEYAVPYLKDLQNQQLRTSLPENPLDFEKKKKDFGGDVLLTEYHGTGTV